MSTIHAPTRRAGPRVQAPPLASVPSAVIASGSCCRGRRFLFLRLATCAPSEHQTVVLGSVPRLRPRGHSQGKIRYRSRQARTVRAGPKFVRQVTAAPKWTPSAKLKLPRFQLQFTQPDLSQLSYDQPAEGRRTSSLTGSSRAMSSAAEKDLIAGLLCRSLASVTTLAVFGITEIATVVLNAVVIACIEPVLVDNQALFFYKCAPIHLWPFAPTRALTAGRSILVASRTFRCPQKRPSIKQRS
jgi:hypothetical protein